MKRKSIIISIICLITLIFASLNVYAAKGSFQVSVKSKSLTVGNTTTLSITAKECAGVFKVTSSDSSVVSVGSVPDWIEEETKTVTLTAKKAGTAKITIKASDVGDTDANEVTGSKTIEITVKAKAESTNNANNSSNSNSSNNNNNNQNNTTKKSNNAYLSTLGVTPKEYDFSGFSKNKTSYSVTVPSSVDSLKVSAKAADSNATVKVTGNTGFEVGSNNKITIKVTAEDGKTTKTYTIKVTKLAEDEEKPGNVIGNDNKELYLSSLSIEGIEIFPEFSKDIYSYTATLTDSNLTEVQVNAESSNKNAKIEITGNTNLVEGENTINLIVTSEGSTEQIVYQIVLTKEASNALATSETDIADTSDSNLIGTIKKYIIIAVVVILLVIIAIIVLVILLRNENKKINEEEDNEEELEFDNNFNDEIKKQTEEIFKKDEQVEGQSVEYETSEYDGENPLDERKRRRGKHF